MDEKLRIPEEFKQDLVDAALKLADFIHKNRIRSVFCIESSSRLPGRLVSEVYSRRFPRDVPLKVFFVAPASLHPGRHEESVPSTAYEKALRTQGGRTILSTIKSRAPIMILDDVIAGGVTLREQHSLFRKIRRTDKGIFLGALHALLGAETLKHAFGDRIVIGARGPAPLYKQPELAGFHRVQNQVFSQKNPDWTRAQRARTEITRLVSSAGIKPIFPKTLKPPQRPGTDTRMRRLRIRS